jgi:cystathionine beta-lyase
VGEDELPMWVADMDFKTAPEIQAAIMDKAGQGLYGYSVIPDRWYQAYMDWWKNRHDLSLKKEWLLFATSVVPAISSIVRKLTAPGEKVLLQTPVYNAFYPTIVNNGRRIIENPLIYEGDVFKIDLADLEQKLADPQTTLMILCNPHNPIGRIWSRDELAQIGELCSKYRVPVISDEIHCDLTDPGCAYVPFASVSEICRENSITCVAPTKTFNLAGLHTSAVIVSEETLRHRVQQGLSTDGLSGQNFFAVDTAIAAFTQGGEWLDELREYIAENKKTVNDFLHNELPQVKAVPSQATYLLWLDCRKVTTGEKDLAGFIRKETGLYLSAGKQYGKAGEAFMRMNIACPRSVLMDGLARLKQGIMACQEQ